MSTTRENPQPLQAAPRERTGALVGETPAASSAPAAPPVIRGYAPPIIDSAPPASSAPAQLPRLWLAFWSDGTRLYCHAKAKNGANVVDVQLDPSDPVVAQAYAFFVQRVASAAAAPVVAASEPAKVDEPAKVEPAEKTRPEIKLPSPAAAIRESQRPATSSSASSSDSVPPTNRNPDRKK